MRLSDSTVRLLAQSHVSLHHVRVLLHGLRQEGHDTGDFERIVRAQGANLEVATDRVSALLWSALWYLAQARTGDEGIALSVARHLAIGSWDLLDYLVATQPTLEEALKTTARLAHATHDLCIAGFEPRAEGLYVYLDAPPQLPILPCIADFTLAAPLVTAGQVMGRRVQPLAVELSRPRPSNPGRWYDFFRCDIQFDAPRTAAVLAREDLAQRVPSADPVLRKVLVRQAAREIPQPAERGVIERATSAIRTRLEAGGAPSLQQVARSLGMSARTLRRRLTEEQRSFSQLTADARCELAKSYLQREDLSLDAIAERLGFAKASAFHRAFKRWTGQTPGQYRKQRLHDAAG